MIVYKIADESGEVLEGSFYEQELLKTETADYYEVEKVLKEGKIGKKKYYLVKFLGWPSKFNMEIPEIVTSAFMLFCSIFEVNCTSNIKVLDL